MAFDVAGNILKTRMKNTILKKGFQGKDAKPEEIKRFKWLNLDNSQNIRTDNDLFRFMQEHPFSVMLPSEDSILPDLVSAINGEIVFISEYPNIAKQFESIFLGFADKFINTGKVFEYPLLQSSNVLIEKKHFQLLYYLKAKDFIINEHALKIVNFISENGPKSKREIRDFFRTDPNIFSRIDSFLYQLISSFSLYKISFDKIDGNIYDVLTNFAPDLKNQPTSPPELHTLIESIISSSLYIKPTDLQRGLKKLFSNEEIEKSISNLEKSGKIFKTKINKQIVAVHKETFEKTNI